MKAFDAHALISRIRRLVMSKRQKTSEAAPRIKFDINELKTRAGQAMALDLNGLTALASALTSMGRNEAADMVRAAIAEINRLSAIVATMDVEGKNSAPEISRD